MIYNFFFWSKKSMVLNCDLCLSTGYITKCFWTRSVGNPSGISQMVFFAVCSCCCIANPILKHWLKKIKLHLEISDCPFLRFFLRLILWEFVLIFSIYWLPIFHSLIILLNALIIGALLNLNQFEVVFCYYFVENLKESLQSKDFALLKRSRCVSIYGFENITSVDSVLRGSSTYIMVAELPKRTQRSEVLLFTVKAIFIWLFLLKS